MDLVIRMMGMTRKWRDFYKYRITYCTEMWHLTLNHVNMYINYSFFLIINKSKRNWPEILQMF